MYYATAGPGATPVVASQEKQAGILIPGQGPYGQHVPPGYQSAQQLMPNAMAGAARYTHAPQAYTVVSAPGGHHPGYTAANVYSSMPYHPGMSGYPTSTQCYIPATQFSPGMGYQSPHLAGRTAPPAQYSLPIPAQAGAPLFAAAGYSPVPAGMGAPGTRTLPMSQAAAAAAASQYPPGYAIPAPNSEGNGPMYPPTAYVPPF